MGHEASRAEYALNWIGRLRHHIGQWSGQPMNLMPWQKEIIGKLFGTLNPDGKRQYRTCYVEVPRKNGKSHIAAAIALYMLMADGEEAAEVLGVANDREQAGIVYNIAAGMVGKTPGLDKHLRVLPATKRIVHRKSSSRYHAIPADVAGSWGYNASCVIFDELHVQKNRELWDSMLTATAARAQPLMFGITTAGYDRETICYELHDYAEKVAKGVIVDPSFLGRIYSAPEIADWTDPQTWKIANPSMGVTITEDYLRQECERAKASPAYQNTFRRLFLNQWTNQVDRWLDMSAWDAAAGMVVEHELAGRECYAALDMSSTVDMSSLAFVFPGDPIEVVMRYWLPRDGIIERGYRDHVNYDAWARAGKLTLTEGNVIDYDQVRADINALGKRYKVKTLAADRWNSTQLILQLDADGFDVVPTGQGFRTMSAPSKALLRRILDGSIMHGGHPILRWNANNVSVKTDAAGNIKPDKSTSYGRIDGIVALIMALDQLERHSVCRRSVYEDRGLVIV